MTGPATRSRRTTASSRLLKVYRGGEDRKKNLIVVVELILAAITNSVKEFTQGIDMSII
jgi:hypothetical protein